MTTWRILFLFLLVWRADGSFIYNEDDMEESEDDGMGIPMDAVGRPEYLKHVFSSLRGNDPGSNECYCSYGVEEGVCLEGNICIKDPKAACYHAMELRYNDTERRMETIHLFGCAPLEKGSDASHLTCHSTAIAHFEPKSIACCYDGKLCNLNITPPAFPGINTHEYEPDGPIQPRRLSHYSYLLFIILVIFIFVSLATLLIYYKYKGWFLTKFTDSSKEEERKSMLPELSGSGKGGAPLNQRTIAQELTILKVIGQGRYGQVRKALLRGSYVAVKTFSTTDEQSWQNEREIYYTQMFNHENLLQFVAADICSEDSITHMLLITDYHELGSLSEYLSRVNTVTEKEAVDLAYTIICGLEHLHSEVHGTGGRKKAKIAHRDLKSRNIIVKRTGVCCIADFGLALRFDEDMNRSNIKVQVGTKRYMAPEVLAMTINPEITMDFLMADVYTLGLVLWEIATRVELSCSPQSPPPDHSSLSASSGIGSSIASSSSSSNSSRRYNGHASDSGQWTRTGTAPFEGEVTPDPSLEEMKRVVHDEGKRPVVLQEWMSPAYPGLAKMTELFMECWNGDKAGRPPALRLKLDLRATLDDIESVEKDRELTVINETDELQANKKKMEDMRNVEGGQQMFTFPGHHLTLNRVS